MIKLISQFDNEKTRLSLATPTCGGCCCCCCCCCLVSTITTAAISARNFGNMVKKESPRNKKKIKSAKLFGFFWPIVELICLIITAIIMIMADIDDTGIILLGLATVFIIIKVVEIKKVQKITRKTEAEDLLIIFSILWAIAFVVEAVICFLILVNM